jgi:hypothetical protein
MLTAKRAGLSAKLRSVLTVKKLVFNQNELETELCEWKQRIQSPPEETQAYIRRGWLNLN